MFNHKRDSNVKIESISSNQIFMFAARDIPQGKELFIDYCHPGVNDKKLRN